MKRLLLFIAIFFFAFNVNAQHWTSEQLVPDINKTGYSPSTGAEFGWSMGASDDWVIVGTLTEKAVIYKQNPSTGELMTDTTLEGSSPFIGFGGDVDISGNTAVVGARNYGTAGGVFVYEYNPNNQTWEPQQTLIPSDGAVDDYFAEKLSIHGDRIAVSARGNGDAGAVYVFKRDNGVWSEFGKYVPSDINNGDDFGADVAIYGDKIVATSTTHYNGTNGFTGAAWVLEDGGTSLDFIQKLILDVSENDFYNNFGSSVEMSQDRVLVGAPQSELSGVASGAVFGWYWDNSVLKRTNPILPDPAEAGAAFGTSICMINAVNQLLVGAPGHNSWVGAVFFGQFAQHVYYQLQVIQSLQPGTSQSFGQSVEAASGKALGGANYGSTNNLTDCGTVEVYGECDYGNINISINWTGTWLESGEFSADEYTWYQVVDFGGLYEKSIQVGTGQNYMPTSNGKYCLKIEKNGCIVLVTVEVTDYVGINDYETVQFTVHPNPASDIIRVEGLEVNSTLNVLNMLGEIVTSYTVNASQTIDVKDMDAGVYFLNAVNPEGHATASGKFVKINL